MARLLVGTVGEGLWLSIDEGQSWRRLKQGMLAECDVRSIAVDPRNPARLYVGTHEGVFLSADGGETFTASAGLAGQVVWSLAVLPQSPDTVLAGVRPAAILCSSDGGAHFRPLPAPVEADSPNPALRFNRVTTLSADPSDAQRLWAGVEIGGVWTSPDLGKSWASRSQGLSSLDIHGLAIVVEAAERRLLTTNNDLNLSLDDGQSWQPLEIGRQFPWPYCRGLVQSPRQPGMLLLGNGDGPPGSAGAIQRSLDGGRTWQSARLSVAANSTIWDFAFDPAQASAVWAYSVSGQLFRSADGGASWHKLVREFGEIRALACLAS